MQRKILLYLYNLKGVISEICAMFIPESPQKRMPAIKFMAIIILSLHVISNPESCAALEDTNSIMEGLFDKNGSLLELPKYRTSSTDDYTILIDSYPQISISRLVEKADTCIKNGDIREGMEYLRSAAARDKEKMPRSDREWAALACSNLGYFLISELHNPAQAYFFLEKGIEIAKALGPSDRTTRLACALYSNMGQLFMLFDDTPRSLFYYKKSFDLAMKIKNDESIINTYVDLVHCAWLFDSLNSIEDKNKEFLQYKNQNTFPWLKEYIQYLNKAVELSLQNDNDGSLEYLGKSLKSIDIPFSTHQYNAVTQMMIAITAMKSERNDLAVSSLMTADSIISRHKLIDLQDDLYRLEARYWRKAGNDSMSNAKLMAANGLRDSLFNMHEYGKILDMQSNWALKKYNRETNFYKNQTGNLLFAILLILLLGLIIFLLLWKRKGKGSEDTKSQKRNKDKAEEDVSDDSKEIYEKVKEFLDNNSAVYDMDFSIETLATETGLKSYQISKAINNVTGKNFSTLVAEIRVKEACRILSEEVQPRPTMEVVAERVGYSRSHFLRVFKSVTGQTTKEFLHNTGNIGSKEV